MRSRFVVRFFYFVFPSTPQPPHPSQIQSIIIVMMASLEIRVNIVAQRCVASIILAGNAQYSIHLTGEKKFFLPLPLGKLTCCAENKKSCAISSFTVVIIIVAAVVDVVDFFFPICRIYDLSSILCRLFLIVHLYVIRQSAMTRK